MNRSDLVAGRTYKRKDRHKYDKEILFISPKNVFYKYTDGSSEGFASIHWFLKDHKPIPEQPELFFIWCINHSTCDPKITTRYYSKHGFTKGDLSYCHDWDDRKKTILTALGAVDAEGLFYEHVNGEWVKSDD